MNVKPLIPTLLLAIAFTGQAAEKPKKIPPSAYTLLYERLLPMAEHGHVGAQHSISLLFDYGKGVKRDRKQAAHWLEKAAMQGDTDAQADLGDRYLQGDGVVKDCLTAYGWYWRAAQRGHFRAALSSMLLEQRLTSCLD